MSLPKTCPAIREPLYVVLYDTLEGREEYWGYFPSEKIALKRFDSAFGKVSGIVFVGIAQMVAYAYKE